MKKGCFHLALDTDAIIVPVAIRDIHRVLPARTWRLTLDQPVQLLIGAPIEAGRYGRERLGELMDDTRDSLQQLLDGVAQAPAAKLQKVRELTPV